MEQSKIAEIVRNYRLTEGEYVMRPTMPALEDYTSYLRGIWDRRMLTNDAVLHQELELRLREYLGTEYLALLSNGTLALMIALRALNIDAGEVITTPFTFPATTHVLSWSGVTPVFCDVDPITFNIDATQIAGHISSRTKAILAVHVFGTPCDTAVIQAVADRYGLYVIYDAAHAFGVKYRGRSIVEYGDMAMLSFHATKVFSTIEGGALVCRTPAQNRRIKLLKDFGISAESEVIEPGINAKLDEFRAAFGLLNLPRIESEIASRKRISLIYRERLMGMPGLRFLPVLDEVEANFCYFPILVNNSEFGMTRDELNDLLRECNVMSRKYFCPLMSRVACYVALPSASPANLPRAEILSNQVLCLPIYGTLQVSTVHQVCDIIEAGYLCQRCR